MFSVVDFQACYSQGNYVIKEIAVCTPGWSHCFSVQTPFEQTKKDLSTNLWLLNNYHKIPFNSGSVAYPELIRFIQTHIRQPVVYVKGLDKKRILEKYISSTIILIPDHFTARGPYKHCPLYDHDVHCAVNAAFQYFDFVKTKPGSVDKTFVTEEDEEMLPITKTSSVDCSSSAASLVPKKKQLKLPTIKKDTI